MSSVPAVKTVPLGLLKVTALPSVQTPPTPLKFTWAAFIVVPLVVMVLPVAVELNVIPPVELHTVPASKDIEPAMFSDGPVPVAKVTVPAETVMSRHAKAPVIVTV